MKIEVTQTFYGRPDESVEEFTLFLAGAVIEAPDSFADMVIGKELAKAVVSKFAPKKEFTNEAQ